MFTHEYRGGYIHGYCDRDECQAQIGHAIIGRFRSYRAAQLAISRAMKQAGA